MKTCYFIAFAILAGLSSCKNKEASEEKLVIMPPAAIRKADMVPPPADKTVKFPSPVAEKDAAVSSEEEENAIVQSPHTEKQPVNDTSKKIIKTGDVHFETKDLAAARRSILHTLKQLGGFAEEDNESLDNGADEKIYNIKARVPANNFDRLFDATITSAIKIDSRHTNVSDVTATYIDMTTRLKNKKILEATYINLLKGASKMRDVLDIEDKITDTRTEIESEQGQLNYLTRQVTYSTLDITFYTKQIQHDTGVTAGYKLISAISDGWKLLQGLFFGIITIWPIAVLAIVGVILFRKWHKNRKITSIKKPV